MSKQEQKICISVFSEVDSKRYRLVIKESEVPKLRVEKIKRSLSKTTKIPIEEQILFADEQELPDDALLADFGLAENTVLILSTRTIQKQHEEEAQQSEQLSQLNEDEIGESIQKLDPPASVHIAQVPPFLKEDSGVNSSPRKSDSPAKKSPSMVKTSVEVESGSISLMRREAISDEEYSSDSTVDGDVDYNNTEAIRFIQNTKPQHSETPAEKEQTTLSPRTPRTPVDKKPANTALSPAMTSPRQKEETRELATVSSSPAQAIASVRQSPRPERVSTPRQSTESVKPMTPRSGAPITKPETPRILSLPKDGAPSPVRPTVNSSPKPAATSPTTSNSLSPRPEIPIPPMSPRAIQSPAPSRSPAKPQVSRLSPARNVTSPARNFASPLKSPPGLSSQDTNDKIQQLYDKMRGLEENYMNMVKEERTKLMRQWSNEKKELLKKTNDEKQELMIENSRLRKELSTRYSIPIHQEVKDEIHAHQEQGLRQKIEHLEKYVQDLRSQNEELKKTSERVLRSKYSPEKKPSRDYSASYEAEKEMIIRNWKEEMQVMLLIYKEQKDQWTREKAHMLEKIQSKDNELSDLHAKLQTISQYMDDQTAETEMLRAENREKEELLRDAEMDNNRNAIYVQSADAAISEMKKQIQKILNDEKAGEIIAKTTTEAAIERKRAERFERENVALSEQLIEESRKRKHLHNILEDMKGNIRVIVRMRPLLKQERTPTLTTGKVEIRDETTVAVSSSANGTKNYDFFRALGDVTSQGELFEEVRPLLQSAIDGYNVCILAYGQTGSGKSFTIYGEEPNQVGVLPRACQELFNMLNKYKSLDESQSGVFTIKCSMAELYLDTLNDLLDVRREKKLEIRQTATGSVTIAGISEHTVRNSDELLGLLELGNKQRQVHKTEMNDRSSRSHTIFTINLSVSMNPKRNVQTKSKLVFVDLAGSERVSKSHSTGDRFKEAQHINKSLSALGDVIYALSTKGPHVPYRNAKLTMLLQDAIGGNSKTLLFANISPNAESISETVSTLGFASRVKHVTNTIVKNVDYKK